MQSKSRLLCQASGLALLLWAGQAAAQAPQSALPAPTTKVVDRNGVDLLSGTATDFPLPGVSIGSGPSTMRDAPPMEGSANNVAAMMSTVFGLSDDGATTTAYQVSSGDTSDRFPASSGVMTSSEGTGATLTYDGAGLYTYTDRDGAVTRFSSANIRVGAPSDGYFPLAAVSRIDFPSGEVWTFSYDAAAPHQLWSVNSTLGYQIKYTQTTDATGAYAVDTNVDYCAPLARTCSFTQNWSRREWSADTTKDTLGNAYTFLRDSNGEISGLRWPSGKSINYHVRNNPNDLTPLIDQATDGAGTWTYTYSGNSAQLLDGSVFYSWVKVTDPYGHTKTVNRVTENGADPRTGKVESIVDELGNKTTYHYDNTALARVTSVDHPESATNNQGGDSEDFTYDGRGNITSYALVPKGATAPLYTLYAGYPADCTTAATAATCNKPTFVTDERGQQTNYSYDPIHGGVTLVTRPAFTNGAGVAARPTTRYRYTLVQTNYTDITGAPAHGQVYRLASISDCPTEDDCTLSHNGETRTDYYYEAAFFDGAPNNHALLSKVVTGATDPAVAKTTAFTYDIFGNVKATSTTDGGVTQFAYDGDRRLTDAMGPDPDGSGPLLSRATHTV